MEGDKHRRTRGKLPQRHKKDEKLTTETEEGIADTDKSGEHAGVDFMQAIIMAVHAEIKAVCSDVKMESSNFCDTLKKDMKEELGNLKEDVNQKLCEIVTELKDTVSRVGEVEQRVADMEEWSAKANEVLSHTLQVQENIQAKLTDLETRSRRNNMLIHWIPEGAEGNNMHDFLEKFIKTELSLPDMDLGIQRCHRSLGPKTPEDANPRSLVIYFLKYRTKELVLRSAWKKRETHFNGKRVFFDQDQEEGVYLYQKDAEREGTSVPNATLSQTRSVF